MSIPIVPKPGVPTLVTDGGQVVVAAPKRTHMVRALKAFGERADNLADCVKEISDMRMRLRDDAKYNPGSKAVQKTLEEAATLLEDFDIGVRDNALELEADLEKFNPDEAYDEDDEITEEEVRKHIALLLASGGGSASGNPEAYCTMMVEEVLAEEGLSVPVLAAACSQVRRTCKFTPSTAEVISAIQEQADIWRPRLMAVRYHRHDVSGLRREIKEATERVAEEKVKQEKRLADQALRDREIGAGDRVRFRRYPMQMHTVLREFFVGLQCWSDSPNTEGFLQPKDLEHALPGDPNYEMPDEVRVKCDRDRSLLPGDRVVGPNGETGVVTESGARWCVVRQDGDEADFQVELDYLTRLPPA